MNGHKNIMICMSTLIYFPPIKSKFNRFLSAVVIYIVISTINMTKKEKWVGLVWFGFVDHRHLILHTSDDTIELMTSLSLLFN